MPPPCGDGACWYWPATPRDEVPGGLFANRAPDLVEGCDRLALRMQYLAALPGKQVLTQLAVERPDLVVLGDRREGTTSQSSCAITWPARSSCQRRLNPDPLCLSFAD